MNTDHLFLAAVVSLTLPAAAVNVITDPGFETTAAGSIADTGGIEIWSNYSDNNAGDELRDALIQTIVVHSGSQALQFPVNHSATATGGFGIVYHNTGDNLTTAGIENQTWEYSFWVYTTGGTGVMDFQFIPSNELNQDQFPAGSTGSVDAATLVPDTWTEITGSFTTEDYALDPTRMKVNFLSPPDRGQASFYLDDIHLAVVPEPSTALASLLGAGLLLGLRRRRGA